MDPDTTFSTGNPPGEAITPVVLRPVPTITLELDTQLPQPTTEPLGMFRGVFVPVCEFAWSVLLFVRFGVIVGESGLLIAIAILVLCATTVSITTTSIAAIVSNTPVSRGGVYALLEGTLGRGLGGSIAIIYFLGLVTLVSVELVGSVQALMQVAPTMQLLGNAYADQFILAFLSLLVCVSLALLPARATHAIASVFLVVLVASFVFLLLGLALSARFSRHHVFQKIVTGPSWVTLNSNLFPADTFSFSNILALIQPCFLGIYSGVNNAKNLKFPWFSIPFGTLLAIVTSLILYATTFTLFAASITREGLIKEPLIGPLLAFPSKWTCVPGVYLVGIGASLQCLIMASNIWYSIRESALLTVQEDQEYVDTAFLQARACWKDEKQRGVILTAFLATLLMLFKDLEVLAEIATMCFLLCYGFSNFACWLLSVFQTPNWRPKFYYHHWMISFTGTVACIALMVHIQVYAALTAIIVAALLAYFIQTRSFSASWGHSLHGLLFHIVLLYLTSAEDTTENERPEYSETSQLKEPEHPPHTATLPRYIIPDTTTPVRPVTIWRPHIITFVPTFSLIYKNLEPESQSSSFPRRLAELAYLQERRVFSFLSQLKSRSALCVVASTVTNEVKKIALDVWVKHRASVHLDLPTKRQRQVFIDDCLKERKDELHREMDQENVSGFVKVYSAPSVIVGQNILLSTVGLGELTPNTVLIAWPEIENIFGRDLLKEMQDLWQSAKRLGLSRLVCKGLLTFPSNEDIMEGTYKRIIDVWWIVQDGHLLLLVAFLLTQHRVWRNCTIRLFTLCHITDDLTSIEHGLSSYLAQLRIKVELVTIVPILLVDPEMSADLSLHNLGAVRDNLVADRIERELESVRKQFEQTHDRRRHPSLSSNQTLLSGSLGILPRLRRSSTVSEPVRAETIPDSAPGSRPFFITTQTVLQLKNAIEQHSLDASLVLYNLPIPKTEDLFPEEGKEAELYVELISTLTEHIPRSCLCWLGKKSRDLLKPYVQ